MPVQTSSTSVTVGLIQMSCGQDTKANLEKALSRIAEAAGKGAKIVCLQELFLSVYFCQSEDHSRFALAEPIPGPTSEALGAAAARHRIALVGSIFEKRAPGVFHNTAVIFNSDGSLLGKYRKMHIPDDPLYYEKFYFTPGDLGFQSFQTAQARIGALVCWDQWFPEGARLTAMTGAQILFYPTAIGWFPGDDATTRKTIYEAWQTIQRSHAIANGLFVAAPNRVGLEGGIEFFGGSFIADPFGQILAQASHTEEEILVVECDLGRVDKVRSEWPFFRDRRIDAYGGLTQRFLEGQT